MAERERFTAEMRHRLRGQEQVALTQQTAVTMAPVGKGADRLR